MTRDSSDDLQLRAALADLTICVPQELAERAKRRARVIKQLRDARALELSHALHARWMMQINLAVGMFFALPILGYCAGLLVLNATIQALGEQQWGTYELGSGTQLISGNDTLLGITCLTLVLTSGAMILYSLVPPLSLLNVFRGASAEFRAELRS